MAALIQADAPTDGIDPAPPSSAATPEPPVTGPETQRKWAARIVGSETDLDFRATALAGSPTVISEETAAAAERMERAWLAVTDRRDTSARNASYIPALAGHGRELAVDEDVFASEWSQTLEESGTAASRPTAPGARSTS